MNQKTTYRSWPDVKPITGNKHRATVWRWVKAGLFPAPVKIGPNSVAWKEHEIEEWAEDPRAWAMAHREGAR
jgi:prophage regulatory protein